MTQGRASRAIAIALVRVLVLVLVLVLGLELAACRSGEPSDTRAESGAAFASDDASHAPVASGARALGPDVSAACAEQRARVRAGPAEPGSPELEAHRVELVGRVRGATALWRREPAASSAAAASAKGKGAHDAVRAVLRRHAKHPELARAALLREGYLFAPTVEEALGLVDEVSLTDLFAEPRIFLLRRGVGYTLERKPGEKRGSERYVFRDGPLAGSAAELLFGDRVGLDAAALAAGTLAVDFAAAQHELGFEALRAVTWSGDVVAAEARYGDDTWIPTLFDVGGPSAKALCQEVPAAAAELVERARSAALRAAAVQARLREVVEAEVREATPFDTARGGGGDDGEHFPLRPRWDEAYAAGQRRFRYQDKSYDVYDALGRPLRPQMCIEFVYDTWERASGTWFAPLPSARPGVQPAPAPRRIVGSWELGALGMKEPRRFLSFVEWSAAHPEDFDVWVVPPEERVQYTKPEAFFAVVAKNAARFRPGDVLVLKRAKWDGHAMYHALLVMETDPFTGAPSLVAGNAARPRLQTLQGVMQITWRRYLERRVRPRGDWLERAVLASPAGAP